MHTYTQTLEYVKTFCQRCFGMQDGKFPKMCRSALLNDTSTDVPIENSSLQVTALKGWIFPSFLSW